jgi:hypothetical protein
MNFDDPTDMNNVSIDGIAERMVLSRAAERGEKQRAARQPPPPPPPPPTATASASTIAAATTAKGQPRRDRR